MKRRKKLILLCLALVLLLACYLLVTKLTAEEAMQKEESGISLGISDNLSAMGWQYEDVSVHLALTEETWSCADDAACPIDQDMVTDLISAASALEADRTIQQPEAPAAYGLDSPGMTLFFTDAAGTTTLSVGNTDPLNGSAYVMLNDVSSVIYLMESSALEHFVLTLYDLVEKEELPAMTNILDLQISGVSDLRIVFADDGAAHCYTDQYAWFLEKDSSLLPLDTELTEALMAELSALYWGDCVCYNADAAALAGYGLTTPSMTLSVLHNEASTADMMELELGAYAEAADSYYARIAGSAMVYLVSGDFYRTFSTVSYASLRAMDVLLVDWYDISDVEITLDGVTHALDLVPVTGSDGLSGLMYDLDGITVQTELGSAFLNAISGTTATDTGAQADAEPVLTVSMRVSSTGLTNILTFAPSGEGYLVQINDAGDLWISAADYAVITDAYAALLA